MSTVRGTLFQNNNNGDGSNTINRLHEDSGVLLGEEKQSPIASAASFVADDNSLTSNNDDNDIRAALTVLATRGELKVPVLLFTVCPCLIRKTPPVV
ncbi:hypothetical protein DIPPA_01132 [Diplonema papillatum]|nr:hypothetical protein DIPPA_01132 [Diplonema papillatum]